MPTPSTDLSTTRYGRRQKPRWVWIAVAVVLIGAGVGWSWWASQTVSDDSVSAQVRGFDVQSDHSTKITLQVSREDPGTTATCAVQGQALDHAVVGERTVEIPPAGADTVTVSAVIRTDRRAVNAVVRECRMSD